MPAIHDSLKPHDLCRLVVAEPDSAQRAEVIAQMRSQIAEEQRAPQSPKIPAIWRSQKWFSTSWKKPSTRETRRKFSRQQRFPSVDSAEVLRHAPHPQSSLPCKFQRHGKAAAQG